VSVTASSKSQLSKFYAGEAVESCPGGGCIPSDPSEMRLLIVRLKVVS